MRGLLGESGKEQAVVFSLSKWVLFLQIHANCRIRRVYFSDRLYSEDELPAEFKLYLPVQNKAKVRHPSLRKPGGGEPWPRTSPWLTDPGGLLAPLSSPSSIASPSWGWAVTCSVAPPPRCISPPPLRPPYVLFMGLLGRIPSGWLLVSLSEQAGYSCGHLCALFLFQLRLCPHSPVSTRLSSEK